jgi:hypothetical protein
MRKRLDVQVIPIWLLDKRKTPGRSKRHGCNERDGATAAQILNLLVSPVSNPRPLRTPGADRGRNVVSKFDSDKVRDKVRDKVGDKVPHKLSDLRTRC